MTDPLKSHLMSIHLGTLLGNQETQTARTLAGGEADIAILIKFK